MQNSNEIPPSVSVSFVAILLGRDRVAKSRNWIWYWTPMFIPLMIFGVILTAHGAPLRFDCSGKGTVDDTQSGSGSFRDSSGKILQGNVMIPVVREFDAKLAIEMNGDSGRIFIPNEMVPSINNGSQDGWWSVKNIKTPLSP
jgi:hypothetical protein